MLRAAQADAHKPVARPARSIAFQNTVELSRGRESFIAAASQGLAAKRPVEFRTFGAFFDAANGLAQRIDFALGVELGIVGGIVIVLQLFGDTAVTHADNVAGRKMHEPGVTALSQKVE